MKSKGALTTGDVARVLGCSTDLVRYYERIGKLPATRTRNGHRTFAPADVQRFAAERASHSVRARVAG